MSTPRQKLGLTELIKESKGDQGVETTITNQSNYKSGKSILAGPAKRTSLVIVEELDERVEQYVKSEGMLKSRFVNEAILNHLIQVGVI